MHNLPDIKGAIFVCLATTGKNNYVYQSKVLTISIVLGRYMLKHTYRHITGGGTICYITDIRISNEILHVFLLFNRAPQIYGDVFVWCYALSFSGELAVFPLLVGEFQASMHPRDKYDVFTEIYMK